MSTQIWFGLNMGGLLHLTLMKAPNKFNSVYSKIWFHSTSRCTKIHFVSVAAFNRWQGIIFFLVRFFLILAWNYQKALFLLIIPGVSPFSSSFCPSWLWCNPAPGSWEFVLSWRLQQTALCSLWLCLRTVYSFIRKFGDQSDVLINWFLSNQPSISYSYSFIIQSDVCIFFFSSVFLLSANQLLYDVIYDVKCKLSNKMLSSMSWTNLLLFLF